MEYFKGLQAIGTVQINLNYVKPWAKRCRVLTQIGKCRIACAKSLGAVNRPRGTHRGIVGMIKGARFHLNKGNKRAISYNKIKLVFPLVPIARKNSATVALQIARRGALAPFAYLDMFIAHHLKSG